ncbi:MAG: acetoacetyl-CoA synthase [Gammaproteobacteria bacterium]|nr:MAG: acetoacetyl-CoA synthase [Gammaproteobacteria bacterium]TLY87308.1 MAG: acetoacetyl-CoA synthase [Gammaproteobacteria bacterium]
MSGPTPVAARPKRATNVTVRGDLLAAAREAGINLSATLERALEEELAALKRRQWRLGHAEAIEAYNEYVGRHAPAFQGARTF